MVLRLHIIAMLLVLLVARLATASDFRLTPSLTVSEEYTDNVFESGTNKVDDYITRVLPGAALAFRSPFFDWSSDYAFDYRYYARRSRNDDTTHQLAARGQLKVVEELMFVDFSDNYSRVSLDISRDTTRESLFMDQSDRNTFSVSPYLARRIGDQNTMKTGYRYVNTWYRQPNGVNKTDQAAFWEGTHEFSPKAGLSVGYTFTHEETELSTFDKHDAFFGGQYEYADRSTLFTQFGNTWMIHSKGRIFSNLFWNAGITHQFDSTTVSVKTGVSYLEDPLRSTTKETSYAAEVTKALKSGMVGVALSYRELMDTESRQNGTRTYSGIVRSSYEILPLLTGRASFTAEKYDQQQLASYTRKFFTDSSVSYEIADMTTLAINYRYTNYSSPGIPRDNWQSNRLILELRKVFQ